MAKLTKEQSQALLNMQRGLTDDDETISLLDHLSMHLAGRMPIFEDDLDDMEDDSPEERMVVNEDIPVGRFFDFLKEFINQMESEGRVKSIRIAGDSNWSFKSPLNEYSPAFQIFITRGITRLETDAEVRARLKKQEKLAKTKKAR